MRLPPQCRRAGGACWFRNASLNRLTLVNQVTNSFHRFLCREGNICSCCTTSTWTGADRAQLPSQHPKSSRMRPASVPKSTSHGKVAVPHQKVRPFIREQGQTYPCLAAPTYLWRLPPASAQDCSGCFVLMPLPVSICYSSPELGWRWTSICHHSSVTPLISPAQAASSCCFSFWSTTNKISLCKGPHQITCPRHAAFRQDEMLLPPTMTGVCLVCP